MTRLLIVEDDTQMRRLYRALFESEGYAVSVARTGAKALEEFAASRPDVVLLDVMLPGSENGYIVCDEMRKIDELVPIVMNSALEDTENRLRGLDVGADDYVPKSAPQPELVGRVNRAVERYRAFQRLRGEAKVVVLGKAKVNLTTMSVVDEDGRQSRLTRTEADIFHLLYEHRGEQLSSEDILANVRGEGYSCNDNTLYIHVSNLRRKLLSAGPFVVSSRGVGYRLAI